ncbi:D-glycero-beta-D-manno-heptose 1,7-bisphosphate 7-phosphatase [Salinicola sp. CPA57]|uniref:D-glycero-beta-D-manno-heptose 1,7-bisphosphate 7-phosphatase n=1 Tax=Salinicola sp. CPA57 TaxID=1949080 RepID=UPI000DA17A84|nr:D-glycero-beta-D-manno-heptose 1,7-bisphosphate 7-phosphatase [Salinicola sp. CPA57]
MAKLIILDRDGVINRDSDAYIKSLSEWEPYPDAIAAIAQLHQNGWTIAIATNQSGIGRGYYDTRTLEQIHCRLRSLVSEAGGEIAIIEYCPHLPADNCDCRKPRAGMLIRIRKSLNIPTLDGCWMVGDSLRDIQAGIAGGCRTALVLTGKGQRTRRELDEAYSDTWICDDLEAFSKRLLSLDV